MAQVGDVGMLEELGVMPGDKVECVGTGGQFSSGKFEGIVWTCFSKHPDGYSDNPCVVYEGIPEGGWMPLSSRTWTFRLISRATHTLWRDMTPTQRAAVPQSVLDDPHNPLQIPWGEWPRAAKGAAMLAHHEGKVIEWTGRYGGKFVMNTERGGNPVWSDDHAYRVRPEPPRVDLMADGLKVGTVAMRDGKADPDSVEWDA